MNRPFFNKSIHYLEAALLENGNNPEFLKILQNELSYRSTDRAKKLKTHVDTLLIRQSKQQHIPPAMTTVNIPASKTRSSQNFRGWPR